VLNDFLRRSNKTLAALMLGASTLFLQSCGGGGTSPDTGLVVGTLAINPATGSIYAGVPTTLTIAGGRAPYTLSSSEPTLLPVPLNFNGNNLVVVANNPGVIDVGLDPNAVPSRSVNITVRDNAGTQLTATYSVLQNFMTGYSIAINSLSLCGVTATDAVVPACAGVESRIDIVPVSAGLRRPGRQIRFSVLYGPLAYIQDDNVTLAPTYLLTTDSTGGGRARFVPTAGAFTQFVAIRVTDVQTGAYQDVPFTLLSAPTAALTVLPATLPTLAGTSNAVCGIGTGTLIVTGGRPPYTATSTSPGILVNPTQVTTSGGTFNVTYGGGLPPNCNTGQVIITDANGTIVSVTAAGAPGTTAPVQPLSASPSAFCFPPSAAAQNGFVNVTGGGTNKVLNTNNAAVATVSPTSSTTTPFTATITTPAASPNGTALITINDGASSVTVQVTRQAVCP
jgi:hypothetical protein